MNTIARPRGQQQESIRPKPPKADNSNKQQLSQVKSHNEPTQPHWSCAVRLTHDGAADPMWKHMQLHSALRQLDAILAGTPSSTHLWHASIAIPPPAALPVDSSVTTIVHHQNRTVVIGPP
eukprot:jgi/Ulvmu1/529/UM001_0537.1